ncbi:hypothetical protein PFISCL1PPCAC_4593, partial [Pristionchus fissidentatus]
ITKYKRTSLIQKEAGTVREKILTDYKGRPFLFIIKRERETTSLHLSRLPLGRTLNLRDYRYWVEKGPCCSISVARQGNSDFSRQVEKSTRVMVRWWFRPINLDICIQWCSFTYKCTRSAAFEYIYFVTFKGLACVARSNIYCGELSFTRTAITCSSGSARSAGSARYAGCRSAGSGYT